MLDGFPFFADVFENENEDEKNGEPRFSLSSRSFDEKDGFLIPLPTDPRETTDGSEFLRLLDVVGGGELQP